MKKKFLCYNWQVCIYHIFNFFMLKILFFWMITIIIERFFFLSFTIITLLISGLLSISVLHRCSDHIDCRVTLNFFFFTCICAWFDISIYSSQTNMSNHCGPWFRLPQKGKWNVKRRKIKENATIKNGDVGESNAWLHAKRGQTILLNM